MNVNEFYLRKSIAHDIATGLLPHAIEFIETCSECAIGDADALAWNVMVSVLAEEGSCPHLDPVEQVYVIQRGEGSYGYLACWACSRGAGDCSQYVGPVVVVKPCNHEDVAA